MAMRGRPIAAANVQWSFTVMGLQLAAAQRKCASAAGSQARARTNLRSFAPSRRVAPERSLGPCRPVGCMGGLDSGPGLTYIAH
jgi:hypothetical protein